jgi:hypothetical protein
MNDTGAILLSNGRSCSGERIILIIRAEKRRATGSGNFEGPRLKWQPRGCRPERRLALAVLELNFEL